MSLDKKNLYRFPWSLNDNPIGWLEITDRCNLHCKGCYRKEFEGHKPLEQIKEEILFLKKWRNCDNISIAGGEPLIHPQINEIVEFIFRNKMKSFILTNGITLNEPTLLDLKKSHLFGLGLHVDCQQERPGWEGKDELELCELRQEYADLIKKVGGLTTTFGITVYKENFNFIPDLVRWSLKNTKVIQGLVFIAYRAAILRPGMEYTVNGQKLKLDQKTLGYTTDDAPEDIKIKSNDIYEIIKKHFPQYEASAYLGGTQDHSSFKWLIGFLIGTEDEILGSMGKKGMEYVQTLHHLFYKSYVVYLENHSGGKKFFLLSLVDPEVRKAFFKFMKNPLRLFSGNAFGLSIGIIQAPDLLPDGRVDMCDSCPDMCYFKGKLVNSCRLDEYRKFGDLITPVPNSNEKG
ncbi:MAG: hypothetical protein AMJ90_07845 [candidate division Zixibacteria bacterium SM23_73_2]|nr:MAG: hypothetical protein AMJ90_07845 [candidate division Zixibacteria bacterium SM23_73_2]